MYLARSMFRILTMFAAAALFGCAQGPIPEASLPDQVTAVCFGAAPGSACSEDGTWCRTSEQCGTAERFCLCMSGHLECTATYTADEISGCTLPERLTTCYLEGTGVCDQEPVGGGTCGCHAGVMSCDNGCDGCPMQPPSEGSACTISPQRMCRYGGPIECTCTAGGFHCVGP